MRCSRGCNAYVAGGFAPWMRGTVDDALYELSPREDRSTYSGKSTRTNPRLRSRREIAGLLARLRRDDSDEPERISRMTRSTRPRAVARVALEEHPVAGALSPSERARDDRGSRRPEMQDSPWPVPALPTHGELARWLGISHERLDILADRRNLSRDSRDATARGTGLHMDSKAYGRAPLARSAEADAARDPALRAR